MDDLRNGVVRLDLGKGLPQERRKDFWDVPRRKTMNRICRASGRAVACLIAAVALTILGGCRARGKKPAPVSAVDVEIQTDGIHLKTGQAEFVLTRSGSLVGRFKHGTQWLTLDEAAPGPGVVVTSGKQVVNDFIRDLGHARIQPATGKPASLGKRG